MIIACAVIVLIIGGAVASEMEVDVFPDLTAPTVTVITEAHGMATEEVERLVSFPIETAVNGAADVRRVRSSSASGISIVWIEFEWGTDIYRARQIISERLPGVTEKLPKGVSNPALAPNTSIMGEIMLIGLTADSTSPMQLRTIADWTLRPRLLSTGGVAQVVVMGGAFRQYQIIASPGKMKFYNVSLNELLKATEQSNQNASGGFINEFGTEYRIRGIGKVASPDELGNAIVKIQNNVPVKVEDVADISIGAAPRIGDASVNGKKSVVMVVMKQPDVNTLELTEKIERNLADAKKSLPPDVGINTRIFRQADFISASVNNVQKALIEGSVFVAVILLFFLVDFRTTIISLTAIPLSLLASVITMKLLGFSLNTMSMGGMAIAIGALVDDAIIDVENVYRRLRENSIRPADEKRPVLRVIFEASVEVRASIINATFIIIATFIPLFFLTGMEGKLLQPLGISFIVALFASLLVSITLTPVLCSFVLTSESRLQNNKSETRLVHFLTVYYKKGIVKALKIPRTIIGVAVIFFIFSAGVFFSLGRSFLPEFNEGSLVVNIVSPPGISLEESDRTGNMVEEILMDMPEIEITARRTGRGEMDEHAQGVNASEIDAPFVLKERSGEEFLGDLRQKLAAVPGTNITIGQPISHRVDHMLSGTRANIAVKIFGSDQSKLMELGRELKNQIEHIPGLVDVNTEQQIEIPQIQIKANRTMLAKYGITIEQFADLIDVAFAGEKISQIYEEEKSYDVILKFEQAKTSKLESLKDVLIDTYDGKKIPLHYVAEIKSASGPNSISRENVQRKFVVSANVSGTDLRSAVNEIRSKVNSQIKLPEGYHIEYGGQFESEANASSILLFTSLLSFLVIFVLLYQEFKDVRLAGVILLNLPLALIGGIFSVWFTSGIITIASIIGFINLFGIATRNGILLVAHYELLRSEGAGLYDSIIQGSLDRLNPILMTALTAGLALIPLIIASDAPGNEILSPMAVVILGGLFTSTLLNIFVIPGVYYLINKKYETDRS
jgi:CzcA family heavy metal efflux pump